MAKSLSCTLQMDSMTMHQKCEDGKISEWGGMGASEWEMEQVAICRALENAV